MIINFSYQTDTKVIFRKLVSRIGRINQPLQDRTIRVRQRFLFGSCRLLVSYEVSPESGIEIRRSSPTIGLAFIFVQQVTVKQRNTLKLRRIIES